MKKHILTIVGILIMAFGVSIVLPAETHTQPASAAQASDKYDGDCTGHETAGRCADKCPNQTDTLQGYDKETGAAVCRSAPTGCPYGDSIPLGAECDKQAPQPDPAVPTDPNEFVGK